MSLSTMRVTDLPTRTLFFRDVIERALSTPDVNLTGLAARWGWPEQTVRNRRDRGHSPTADGLALLARRRFGGDWAMRDAELLDALQTIGHSRVLVAIASRGDLPERIRPADVLSQAIHGMRQFTTFVEQVNDRTADGVVCRDDAATLAMLWSAARSAGDRAIMTAERCAGL